ncbi:PIN domain-containing protein [Rhizobium sp. YTU87027]|uniref:PIN domain-containing protein n=1 Tax=Rhizobium sp. YTU87027 TaxID=3417741 RepID=UPI003D6992EE
MQADLFLFPDSNVFIQCKPLKDLDWSPWKNYSHVRLIVTRPVLVEIDRQKNKGSDRLGQRARKASSLFREMLKAEHNDMVIREADPRVTAATSEECVSNAKWPVSRKRTSAFGRSLL